MCGYDSVVKKLIEYGADLDAADVDGNTSLHFAARSGFSAVVEALVNCKANKTVKNKDKKTALDLAPDKATQAILTAEK